MLYGKRNNEKQYHKNSNYMRYYSFIIATALLLQACNNSKPKQPEAITDTTMAAPSKDFSKLTFANKKDVVCHMPLTAGIGDTSSYQGKLYGFCSAECKAEFTKDPAGYVAKAK